MEVQHLPMLGEGILLVSLLPLHLLPRGMHLIHSLVVELLDIPLLHPHARFQQTWLLQELAPVLGCTLESWILVYQGVANLWL